MLATLTKLSKGHKISSSGAGVAVLCFFLPWILVSCNGQPVKALSGWELAAGTTIPSGLGERQIDGRPILFLVLLAAVAVLALAYLAIRREHLTKLDGFGSIALGLLPLLVLFGQFSSTRSEAAQQGITVDYQYGLWGLVLGYLAVVVGGVVNLREPALAGVGAPTVPTAAPTVVPGQAMANIQIGPATLDMETLKKAARVPLLLAVGLAVIVMIGVSFGNFWSLVFTLIWALAGSLYTRSALLTGASHKARDLALNGATLGGMTSITYDIIAQIGLALQNRGSAINLSSLIATVLEAAFIGALAALAWYVYQQERNVTS